MSTFGHTVNPKQLRRILDHVFSRNNALQGKGQRGTPVLIWGSHGLGKTQSVIDYARENQWKVAYCAPAQFEEMGDLHGMPTLMDPDKTISGDEYTVYSPPEWVPKEEGPGILLLDDINRAFGNIASAFSIFASEIQKNDPDLIDRLLKEFPESRDFL